MDTPPYRVCGWPSSPASQVAKLWGSGACLFDCRYLVYRCYPAQVDSMAAIAINAENDKATYNTNCRPPDSLSELLSESCLHDSSGNTSSYTRSIGGSLSFGIESARTTTFSLPPDLRTEVAEAEYISGIYPTLIPFLVIFTAVGSCGFVGSQEHSRLSKRWIFFFPWWYHEVIMNSSSNIEHHIHSYLIV